MATTTNPGTGEYLFKIEAFTPETMPMARLAEYLTELVAILGESKSVHLIRIEAGSTALVHNIEHEAIPKVHTRTEAIRLGEAPRDAQAAYRRVNRFLREDNAKAVLRKGKKGAKVLEFPGTEEAEEVFAGVNQVGTISGVVVRVGGVGDTIRVLMESEGEQIAGCHTTRHMAKALARHLFEPVRLNGQGYWSRDAEGLWALKHFRIDGFDPVEATTLSEVLTELRAIAGEWDDDAYEDLMKNRRLGSGTD